MYYVVWCRKLTHSEESVAGTECQGSVMGVSCLVQTIQAVFILCRPHGETAVKIRYTEDAFWMVTGFWSKQIGHRSEIFFSPNSMTRPAHRTEDWIGLLRSTREVANPPSNIEAQMAQGPPSEFLKRDLSVFARGNDLGRCFAISRDTGMTNKDEVRRR